MAKRRVLMTGASRGIGAAILSELEGAGYEVAAPDRSQLDLADPASIASFGERNGKKAFDILINNAGINVLAEAEAISDKDLELMMATNLVGPIKLIRLVAPHMKERHWGRIVNISSIFGIVSRERRGAYSATKFGINGVTKAMAVELGPYNILVNSVCPGYTDTELTRQNVPAAEKARLLPRIPLRRFAEPAEIARTVRFLVSEDNTYITGQTIVVDGGFTSC